MIFRNFKEMDSRFICNFLKVAPAFTMMGGLIMGMVLMAFMLSHKSAPDSLKIGAASALFMILILATTMLARRMADELASRL